MSQHVVPFKIYAVIFATLLLLTLVTVDVATYNFGRMNIYVALGVATAKATLVILYFMHVRYAPALVWVFAAAGFVWLFLLLLFTLSDFITRGWIAGFMG
jgi:cytochrome c oxidase subunit 4